MSRRQSHVSRPRSPWLPVAAIAVQGLLVALVGWGVVVGLVLVGGAG